MEYTEEYIEHVIEIRQLNKLLSKIRDKMSEAAKNNDVKFHKYLGQSLEVQNYITIRKNWYEQTHKTGEVNDK